MLARREFGEAVGDVRAPIRPSTGEFDVSLRQARLHSTWRDLLIEWCTVCRDVFVNRLF